MIGGHKLNDLPLTIIVLTYQSEKTLARTLRAARKLTDDLRVVDSYSSDGTRKIAESFGAQFVQHEFADYAQQRNWAIENLSHIQPWQLHLDADEELSIELVASIAAELASDSKFDAYFVRRSVVFMGRRLRFGGLGGSYHARLFRSGFGRCEARRYDQHFDTSGQHKQLHGELLDHVSSDLSTWTSRHNAWSTAEVTELLDPSPGAIDSSRKGPIGRARQRRTWYYKLPPLLRPFVLVAYRYVFRCGFLDGKEGLIFHMLQGFWFRFLIDAKVLERRGEEDGRTCLSERTSQSDDMRRPRRLKDGRLRPVLHDDLRSGPTADAE